jgi:hypothetical protein
MQRMTVRRDNSEEMPTRWRSSFCLCHTAKRCQGTRVWVGAGERFMQSRSGNVCREFRSVFRSAKKRGIDERDAHTYAHTHRLGTVWRQRRVTYTHRTSNVAPFITCRSKKLPESAVVNGKHGSLFNPTSAIIWCLSLDMVRFARSVWRGTPSTPSPCSTAPGACTPSGRRPGRHRCCCRRCKSDNGSRRHSF